jgi:hypothetical protein
LSGDDSPMKRRTMLAGDLKNEPDVALEVARE